MSNIPSPKSIYERAYDLRRGWEHRTVRERNQARKELESLERSRVVWRLKVIDVTRWLSGFKITAYIITWRLFGFDQWDIIAYASDDHSELLLDIRAGRSILVEGVLKSVKPDREGFEVVIEKLSVG